MVFKGTNLQRVVNKPKREIQYSLMNTDNIVL